MNTRNFYQNLSTFSKFSQAFSANSYQKVPDDWWIIVADIIGSTKAIEAGHYKSVNFIGSLPIIAVINLLTPLEIPYVFGGDGASLLIANEDKKQVLEVLIATAQLADSVYGLQYRLGAVSVKIIHQQNSDIQVAKFNVSKNYQQAFFMGGGLSLADSLVKQDTAFQINISRKSTVAPDFSGLECRWQDILNRRGQVLSLMIEVVDNPIWDTARLYQSILQHLENIVGNKSERSAVTKQNLIISLSPKQLFYEAKAFTPHGKTLKQVFKIIIENLLGKFLMKFAINQWRFYKENTIKTTDAEKFDDTLRMVIAVTEQQQKQLTSYLEREYQAGKLIYGIHVSNRALMTCLIFERHGQQVHFIDAADGGYALAAKSFKQRKKQHKERA